MLKARPNIILIVLDTVRTDHLSCYGYARETTPFLDRMASEGALFLNSIAPASWTLPSHVSLFTGTYPSRHRASAVNQCLAGDLTTLAEVLGEQGYRTMGICGNPFVNRRTGLDRGFQDYIFTDAGIFKANPLSEPDRDGKKSSHSALGRLERAYGKLRYGACGAFSDAFFEEMKKIAKSVSQKFAKTRYGTCGAFTNALLKKWIRANLGGKDPFFIFINYLEAHLAYRPPADYLQLFLEGGVTPEQALNVPQDWVRYLTGQIELTERDFAILRALYDAELRFVDDLVKELMEFLIERQLLDDTLVMITSDHGENIGEHRLMSHILCVYDTLVRVPLLLWHPRRIPAHRRVESLVQLTDAFPTVLELLGIENDKLSDQNQGISLLRSLEKSQREYAISELLVPQYEPFVRRVPEFNFFQSSYNRSLKAIRTETHKLIWSSNGSHELYDMVRDPSESINIVDAEAQLARVLEDELKRWVAAHETSTADGHEMRLQVTEEYDEYVEKLKGLGYM